MPRSRSVSPRGSSDSFHLASTCDRSSSAHRSKLCGHQRPLVTNSVSSTAFTSSGPHRKKDKDKDKDKDAEGDDARKDNKCAPQDPCGEDIKGGKPCFQDDDNKAKNDPCASVPSEKKKNLPCKMIPVSLPPLMCDVNDRPTVHQRRAEQAEVRARLARENEESVNQNRERGGYNSGSQTPGYGSQKGGSNCPAGAHGAQTTPGSGLGSDTDCCSMGQGGPRSQGPQGTAGGSGAYGQAGCGPGAYGQAGYGSGAYGQAGYGPGAYGLRGQGSYRPGSVGRANCPPGTFGPLATQAPGCPPIDGGGAGGYGSQTTQPYGNQGEAHLGYQTGGRYGEPYPPASGQLDDHSRVQPSPFGAPQGPTMCSSQSAPQFGGSSGEAPCGAPGRSPGGAPGGASRGGRGGGGIGPQDDDQIQVNCICTMSQSDSEPQGGATDNSSSGSPGGFPLPGYPVNQFEGQAGYAQGACVESGQGGYPSGQGGFQGGPLGGFQQGNQYSSGGAMPGPKGGLDVFGTCSEANKDSGVSGGYPQSNQQGGLPRGRPSTPQGGQSVRPPLVQQGIQKSQLRSQQSVNSGQRNVQQRDQGATQIILQIDAGRMLLGQQNGPICIPCTMLMPVEQCEGGPDDESMPTWTAQDSNDSGFSTISHQQSSQCKGAGQQGKTGGPLAEGVLKRQSTQDPRAFRPAPKGQRGTGTQRFGGQPPVQQNMCNQSAADFSSQAGSRRGPYAIEGSPQVAVDSSPSIAQGQGGAFCQGAGYSQGPGPLGQSPALGTYKQGQDGVCTPQNTRLGQGMGLSQQPGQSSFQQGHGGGLCHLPGGPSQGMGQSQGYLQGLGGFQVKNAPQDPYQSGQGSYSGQRSGPSGGFCHPGVETGQGCQQGGSPDKAPGAQPRPTSGQGNLPPGDDACRSQGQGVVQQKTGQCQQKEPDLDCKPGNVSFQNRPQDQCCCHQGPGQYSQNGSGFAGGSHFGGFNPNAGVTQNDSQQASALAMCIQRCCNAAAFNSGRSAHEDSTRGRHRLISATGAPDCGAEGVGARHGRQRRSNGHPKGPIDDDDISSKLSCSRDTNCKNDNEKDPSAGIEVPTACAYPVCVIPCQPPCCVIPCQSQSCPSHTCCWPPPTCMCCMPKCCSGSATNSPNGAPNVSFGASGSNNPSSDDTSYGGCRPCCMRYGGSNPRRACRHTTSRHSNRPLPVIPQFKENSSLT